MKDNIIDYSADEWFPNIIDIICYSESDFIYYENLIGDRDRIFRTYGSNISKTIASVNLNLINTLTKNINNKHCS